MFLCCARANVLPWETPRPPRVRKEAKEGGGRGLGEGVGRGEGGVGGMSAVARIHKREPIENQIYSIG